MTRPIHKTKLMLRVEVTQGRSLEDLLPELVNEYGLSRAADRLNVSKATLNYWLLRFGILTRHVALRPGQRLEIVQE